MSTSNNPFDDEDIVLKAFAELIDGSFERAFGVSNVDNRTSAHEPTSALEETKQSESPVPLREGSPVRDRRSFSRRDSSFYEEDETILSEQSFIVEPTQFRLPEVLATSSTSASSGRDSVSVTGKVSLEQLELLYQCPICLELPRGVVHETLCCSQLFCEGCLKGALDAITDRSCPLCRGEAKFRRNEVVEASILHHLSSTETSARAATGVIAAIAAPQYPNLDDIARRNDETSRSLPPRPPRASSAPPRPDAKSKLALAASATDTGFSAIDKWSCTRCTLLNPVSADICEACNFPSPLPVSGLNPDEGNRASSTSPERPAPRSDATFHRRTGSSVSTPSPDRSFVDQRNPPPSNESEAKPSARARTQVRCPVCNVVLRIPDSLRSPSEPFTCGNCWNKISLPSASDPSRGNGAVVRESQQSESSDQSTGRMLLKLSSGTLLRKDRWKQVNWCIDAHGLSFTDRKGNMVRRIHIHPFIAFSQVAERRSSSKPGVVHFVAKMVENPRSALATSPSGVRQGTFSTKLVITDLCEVASDNEPAPIISFIEAVERAVNRKRLAMVAGLA